ncbi:MAG TPA: hypothetical protein VFO65_06895, partial [Acidimicrobiales bacterium]|nr:hypothetical protein [Acidimicrobiales bacterium]
RLSSGGAEVVTGVVVDLGSARPIDLVVGRGVAGQVLVELSDDGSTFRPAATQAGPAFAVAPPGRPSARFVRVRSATGLDLSLLAEVSVW